MLARKDMRGLYALPPTPFDGQGRFLEDVYRENLRKLVAAGVDAIVSPGSNGEWWSLDEGTRRRQLETLGEECRGKTVSAACCSATYTEESIRWTRIAAEIGLDAVLNVPPFYYPLSNDELRRYWHSLAEACPNIGLMMYNFPIVAQQCPADLQNQLAAELPSLCGSKESHRDFDTWLAKHRGSDLAVFPAYDRGWFTSCFRLGGRGIFSTLCGALPNLATELYQACVQGQWERADSLEAEVWALRDLLDSRDYLAPYNPIARNKALVNAAGWLDGGECRAPLISVPPELTQRLRGDLTPGFERWLAK